MKQIIIILVSLLGTQMYSQNRGFDLNNQREQEQPTITTPSTPNSVSRLPSVEIRGRDLKPDEAARIFEMYGVISRHGIYIQPKVVHNQGYGRDGTFSRIYIDGELVGEVQFLDETERNLLPILSSSSTVSTREVMEAMMEACPTQMAVIRRAYEEAVQKAKSSGTEPLNREPQVGNYGNESRNYSSGNRSPGYMYQRHDGRPSSGSARGYGGYGQLNSGGTKTTEYECSLSGVEKQYPKLTEYYLQTGRLSEYKPVKWRYGRNEYRRVKNCVTGKNWGGRNAGWIAGAGGGLLLGGIAYAILTNLDSGGGGGDEPSVPHTEPR